jgi:hypothetical protein
MSPKIHQGKPPRTDTAPVQVLKPPRPFADPAARPETTRTPDPDFAARIERAARYGHRLDGIAFPADQPSPPGGPVLQRMKRTGGGLEDPGKKKQVKPNPITNYFTQTKNQTQIQNLASTTNSTLTSLSSLAPKTGKEESSSPPQTKKQEEPKPKSSFAELQKQKKQKELIKIRKDNPHLANVPDDWIEFGTHNPGGPPIHLKPPAHQGPSKETVAQKEKHAYPHIIDLSTGEFNVPNSAPYKIDRNGAERGNLTRSDVRNYAMLTNAYLASLSGSLTATQTERDVPGSIGKRASEIASKERNQNTMKYGKGNVVAHVPDSSISGVSHSPMGFMRMTNDANTIVGYSSGIGFKAYNHEEIGSILVKELVGEKAQHHYYTLPSNTSNVVSNNPTTDTSKEKFKLNPDEFQDEFAFDDDTELMLQQVEEQDKKKQTDENEKL